MNQNYVFYHDPGHGWLAVLRKELQALGIADKITSCSYQSADTSVAYLEEDCDLTTFAEAKGWTAFPSNIPEVYREDIFIRRLPHYHN